MQQMGGAAAGEFFGRLSFSPLEQESPLRRDSPPNPQNLERHIWMLRSRIKKTWQKMHTYIKEIPLMQKLDPTSGSSA
jgi:hypothetical protein